jgi:hypothetical protein
MSTETRPPPTALNTWDGFAAEKLPPVDPSLVEELVEPIVNHIHMTITGQDRQFTAFKLDWYAHMLQKPWVNTKVAILLQGPEGCGKGFIPEWQRRCILGLNCTSQTSKPDYDLFGKHAEKAHDRIFIQVDELKSSYEFKDPLKNLITSDQIRYERKNHPEGDRNNYANLLFTTNNANALYIGATDRRFVVFECKTIHPDELVAEAYFSKLAEHMARPDVQRAWFQFLCNRDISHRRNFQTSRPKTECYRAAQQGPIPVIARFLSTVANDLEVSTAVQEFQASVFYKKYVDFHTEGNYKSFLLNSTSFGTEMTKVKGKGIERKKVGRLNHYFVSPVALKEYLVEAKEYDENA